MVPASSFLHCSTSMYKTAREVGICPDTHLSNRAAPKNDQTITVRQTHTHPVNKTNHSLLFLEKAPGLVFSTSETCRYTSSFCLEFMLCSLAGTWYCPLPQRNYDCTFKESLYSTHPYLTYSNKKSTLSVMKR